MRYRGNVIRPPSEAQSLILQVTYGCSHNRCAFCPTYKGTPFSIRPFEEIHEDVEEAARSAGSRVRRIFLCDGDALVVPQGRLLPVFDLINASFPNLERIGVYGNAKSILLKKTDELRELRDRKLGILYLGVESGDDEVLKKVCKGADRDKFVRAANRIKEADISLSVTVLLGIGGVHGSPRHALKTAELLTAMDPDFVGALTLMVVPGTPLHREMLEGSFQLPDTFQLIEELGVMIAHTDLSRCYFTSNHASNYLPIRARLPEQKEEVLRIIRDVLSRKDPAALRPEYLRAL